MASEGDVERQIIEDAGAAAIGADVLDLDDVLHGCRSYLDAEYAAIVTALMKAPYPPGRHTPPYRGVDEPACVDSAIRPCRARHTACRLRAGADLVATPCFVELVVWHGGCREHQARVHGWNLSGSVGQHQAPESHAPPR